ncbi:hypothetical protein D9756_002132 [Leucocoprinus leucothites]|uniref:Uncharacterized protein n=1 Tax=Leucocoprinus leucothites TaxID=201217 RepID=A0A8H5LM26_9AGAR|nr:hypothetical protein D9756_002132 [Leucoagaricus leucothites]
MPFPVSISFSSNTFPVRPPASIMPPLPASQKPHPNPAISSGVKRSRPLGLWKARRYGPALPTPPAAPTPSPHTEHPRRRIPPGSESDSDKEFYRDASPHSRALVTKHQSQQHQVRQDYFAAIPQPADDSSDDDSDSTRIARTRIMDVSTTAGPGDLSLSTSTFTYEDWLDLKQLFAKACEQYEFDDPSETLPLLRGVIHECHRCLLSYHDPYVLFSFSHPFAAQATLTKESGTQTPASTAQPGQKTRGRAANPEDIPTSFHTLLGTTLFFFGNSIAANPELALPGEPPIPVPYWIAALDVFESGEHLPSRIDSFVNATTYKSDNLSRDHTPPPREDWRMGVMWGRTLVALATEMADRHRNDPPPPEPEHFPSPFPTNTDYLKTGTIWDDEPEWPAESLFGLIAARRAPIARRMMLSNATPHEILQLAMDHFSRGIFYMPRHTSNSSALSRQTVSPQFSRSKSLYEIADEVLLLAEKLPDPEERKEWAVYAESILNQIHASQTRKYQGQSTAASASTSASKDIGDSRSVITEGLLAKAHGRTCLVIGSTMAEIIEEKMDEGPENEETIGSLMRSEEAEEVRAALLRAIDFFERARMYIVEDTLGDEEELEEEDDDEDMMSVDDDDEADDEQEAGVLMSASARARGKQRRDPKADEARRTRLEARRAARTEARRLYLQEAEEEKLQLSQYLAEALCSLANLTESKEQQEEYYRRAEAETGVRLFDEGDDEMDEGK